MELLGERETLFGRGSCGLCGKTPPPGWAAIGDQFYCHGDFDPSPTCYMRAQIDLARIPTSDWRIELGSDESA
jgi:hypothetical protein